MVTQEANNDTAKDRFIMRMNHSDMYFIEEEIPKNESDENAHVLCGDEEGAKKYCPTRWRAMQNWFNEAHMVSEENSTNTLITVFSAVMTFFHVIFHFAINFLQ